MDFFERIATVLNRTKQTNQQTATLPLLFQVICKADLPLQGVGFPLRKLFDLVGAVNPVPESMTNRCHPRPPPHPLVSENSVNTLGFPICHLHFENNR